MRKIILAVVVAFCAPLGAVATTASANTPGYQTPWGVSAHSPTFGLPPVGLPIESAPDSVKTILMYDSVTPSVIPGSAPAVAGYVSGQWPTFFSLPSLFPHSVLISIAPQATEKAKCLDVEPGDAVIQQVYGWVEKRLRAGAYLPCVYSSLSEWLLIKPFVAHIPRSLFLEWDADWTNTYHLDAGFDATQWTSHALNRNIDGSAVTVRFLTLKKPPPPPVKHCIVPRGLTGLTLAVVERKLKAADCKVGRIVQPVIVVDGVHPHQGTTNKAGSAVTIYLKGKVR